ncbi:hypothetical protein [Methylobacterium sp. 17Sr1-1]|uniref:hypothetical protein n=1 Tax=Methylobacterium sp. 17Sr1-1 TaxID=2202826 RepID=UPI000D6F5D05|nr:hypothetical protein [Methylobacterium sp. 17Sr1-1]AWN54632.1 hypothetical protein DK412_25940 [Methylobacterium sp. 17Sr1-1]
MAGGGTNIVNVELQEITEDEFFILVSFQDKGVASLYLRGDRQYAAEFLEVARRRILLTVTGLLPGDRREAVAQELARLRDDVQLPRK